MFEIDFYSLFEFIFDSVLFDGYSTMKSLKCSCSAANYLLFMRKSWEMVRPSIETLAESERLDSLRGTMFLCWQNRRVERDINLLNIFNQL